MNTSRDLYTSFKLSSTNIPRLHEWQDELFGILSARKVLHTLHPDFFNEDECDIMDPDDLDESDPNHDSVATYLNAEAEEILIALRTDDEVLFPGTLANNLETKRIIKLNLDPDLVSLLPVSVKVAHTWLVTLNSLYTGSTARIAEDLVQRWASLRHLDTQTITEYWSTALQIHATMQQNNSNSAFAPFLPFSAFKRQVVQQLLKPEFGSSISNLQNKEHANKQQLLTDLLQEETNLGWKPKSRDLALMLDSVNDQHNGAHRSGGSGGFRGGRGGFRGGRGGFRGGHGGIDGGRGGFRNGYGGFGIALGGRGRGGYAAGYGGRGGYSFGGSGFHPYAHATLPHVLETPRSEPNNYCPICGKLHWKWQCWYKPSYATDALLPFPPNAQLIPLHQIKPELRQHPKILELYHGTPMAFVNANDQFLQNLLNQPPAQQALLTQTPAQQAQNPAQQALPPAQQQEQQADFPQRRLL
ncbi:hypothetical protein HDU98_010073 [Podochytrium sp. JEL0797]|nr:hypothetical protein HDU98_010073 [Podochytrium sp. JEL0797]